MPIPGGIQGQAGCGSGQPGLLVGDPAHSRGLEPDEHRGPFQPRPFYDSKGLVAWGTSGNWSISGKGLFSCHALHQFLSCLGSAPQGTADAKQPGFTTQDQAGPRQATAREQLSHPRAVPAPRWANSRLGSPVQAAARPPNPSCAGLSTPCKPGQQTQAGCVPSKAHSG